MLVVNPLWGSSTAEPGLTTSNLLSKATMHCPSIPSMTNLILSPSSILRSRRDLTLLSTFHDCAGSVTWAPPPPSLTADASPKRRIHRTLAITQNSQVQLLQQADEDQNLGPLRASVGAEPLFTELPRADILGN